MVSTINQGENSFLHTVKTVDWLINNTEVSIFDPIKFQGYQRKISSEHSEKIAKFLGTNFYLPTPIICACDSNYNDQIKLRIVDGQHRVEAFKILKDKNKSRFDKIKGFEISVIVMENVSDQTEIDTFITINKTSKRVDTSLAYVLKNKLNRDKGSHDLTISKYDYLAVELAVKLNEGDRSLLWKQKLSFTGVPTKESSETISLNSFVKATRRFIGQLDRRKVISIDWENEMEIKTCLNYIEHLINIIWIETQNKWPNLFSNKYKQANIIQGPIGYSSIMRFISNEIKNLPDEAITEIQNEKSMVNFLGKIINSINLKEDVWFSGNKFSKLTSESGYNIIVHELELSKRKM